MKINNYRCLEDTEIEFSDITTIIGPNGAGKSSILRALDWFFNGTALSEDDVRAGADPRQIAVEVEFGELTEDDRLALAGNIAGDRAVIRRSWLDGVEGFQAFAYAYPMFREIRSGSTAMDKRSRYKEFSTAHPEYGLPGASSIAAVENALREWEMGHPDELSLQQTDCSDLFGFSGRAAMSGLFDYVFVSADLRADEEARDVRSSVIGRILEQAIDRREADEEFRRLGDEIAVQQSAIQDKYFAGPLCDISGKFTSMVGELARGRAVSVKPVIPAFKPPQVQFRLEIADGSAATRVEQQGHGFRRALLIAALRLLADSTAASSSRVICLAIEEPELFQHPVQARTFAMVLRKLVNDRGRGVQVTYATHSPFFLEAEGFTQIRRVTRSAGDGGPSVLVTSASSQAIEDRLASITDPADVRRQLSGVFLQQLPEAMFASVVILVEGSTDQAILEGCALRTDPLNANGIVVVAVTGKSRLPLAHAILSEFGIPCLMVFDGDSGAGTRAERKGKSREQAERDTVSANRRMFSYLGVPTEDHPQTLVTGAYAVLDDTLETLLEREWPDWDRARRMLIREGRGARNKDAATYQMAAREASTPPPGFIEQVIRQAVALSPEH